MRQPTVQFIALTITLAGCLATKAHAQDNDLKYLTVQYQTVPRYQTFDARIEAIRRATVSAETNGVISEINFDVDDYVKAGSVLLRITDVSTRAKLSGVEANVSEAQAQYNVAKIEFDRIEKVYQQKLVSQSAYDKADAELKAALQRLTAAKSKVKEVLEQLRYTVVKAPFSGVVAQRHVELGELAKVGQPLMSGYDANEFRAVTDIPQSMVGLIRTAKQASIQLGADQAEVLASTQITVFPEADPATHTYHVRVKLPNVPAGIYPGHLVKIQFAVGEQQKLQIPLDAVVLRSELQAVYVVIPAQGKTAEHITLRQIRIGKHNPNKTVDVLAGLNPGETIALDPIQAAVYLKEMQQH